MALSSAFSTQAQMLSPAQLALIEEDYVKNPNAAEGPPVVKIAKAGREYSGPLYAGDAPSQQSAEDTSLIGPLGLPPAAAALEESRLGALSRTQGLEGTSSAGALSRTAPAARPAQPDIAAMLRQYIPEDDSQSRYLALAAGFAAPTKTGSFGDQIGNVAAAMQQQKAEQEKTRAHYVPLIMQQVAAQQAREEQNQYRLEAQQQAQEAAKNAATQAALERSHQNELQRNQLLAMNSANIASRESIAANKLTTASAANAPEVVEPITPILGVPVPTKAPWANQSNAKDANKVRAAEVARGAKEIESDADAAKKALATAQEAQRFMTLNANKGTGGLSDKFAPGQFVQSFGADYADMQGITARLVPGMREPGSGSTSDFDAKMFQRGTVSVDKPKEVNDTIAQGYINRAKLAQDYADFRATYLEQNGTLQGANKHWSEYVNSNPIFDKTYAEVPRLNDKRVPWRDYFASKVGGAASSAPAGGSPAMDPVAAAKAELARRQGSK